MGQLIIFVLLSFACGGRALKKRAGLLTGQRRDSSRTEGTGLSSSERWLLLDGRSKRLKLFCSVFTQTLGIAHNDNSVLLSWKSNAEAATDKCWLSAAFINTLEIMQHAKLSTGRFIYHPFSLYNKDAVNIQMTEISITWQATIQTEQTSAEELRAVLFPEAEQRISRNLTGLLGLGSQGCRGNVCGPAFKCFFKK